MNIKVIKEYKLKGERNNRPRQPIIWGDKIYLIFVYDKKGFIESKIQCLNLESFELIWEFPISHVINNIFVSSQETLIASFMNGTVLSLNLETGFKIWEFNTDESNIGPVSNEFDNKIVFSGIQAKATSTWCIEIKSGQTIWKVKNNGHSYIPIIYNDKVYNCIANDIFCLSFSDGSILWTQTEKQTYLFNPKILKENVIVSGHGIINIYNLETGVLSSTIDTGEKSSIREIISSDNNIYFGDEKGHFYSYSINKSDTTLNWKTLTEGAIQTIPSVLNENIFVLNDSSKLLCIDKFSGQIKKEMKVKGEGNISGITIIKNKMYFSCSGGHLYECEIQN
jgi:outer membrane protein assembly factor BamB